MGSKEKSRKEVPAKVESRNVGRKANIKTQVAKPTTQKKPESRDHGPDAKSPPGLENSRKVPRKVESRSALQKTNIKMHTSKPTTWKRPKSRDSPKETDTPPAVETSREVPTKRSGGQKTNIKMRVSRPTTWKKPKSRAGAKETDIPLAVETSRQVLTKVDSRSHWQKASVKIRVTRPTTWKRPKSRDSAKETDMPPILERSEEIHRKGESRRHWRRASIKMWVTMPATWRRPKSRDRTKETETPSGLESSKSISTKMGARKAWRKANLKMEIIKTKAKIKKAPLEEGEGKSKFVLANLEHYTNHPNLIQYYESFKVTEPQNLLGGNKKIERFMSRVTEFDQNKTLLIMTNNPPPSPVNWQGKENPPCYFSQELLVKPQEQQKIPSYTGLPLMKKKLKAESRTPFPVVILEDAKPKREQWYRFSTKADFKSEAMFSKLHALKKQQEAYPKLSFVTDFRSAASGEASKWKLPTVTWEPLTLATLLEEKPTLTVPLPGLSPFRYGRAPQWFINTTSVPD